MGRTPWLFRLLLPVLVAGHGMMTKPVSRNGNSNGLAAGGPPSVHTGGYTHGMCGNSKTDNPQEWNRAGSIMATYTEGEEIEVEITVTAHHMGLFQFDLCTNAADLTEACFNNNRLLLAGCECQCKDNSNNCPECGHCRQYWKAWMPDEGLWPATLSTYNSPVGARPVMEGHYLTRAYYIVKLRIPENTRTSHGVLRWHWMSTNSCSGTYSQPEEFWNCADIAIKDSQGSVGPDIIINNVDLETRMPKNLKNDIDDGTLTGLVTACPVHKNGQMELYGPPDRYHCGKLCGGSPAGGEYAFCYTTSNPPCKDDSAPSPPSPATTKKTTTETPEPSTTTDATAAESTQPTTTTEAVATETTSTTGEIITTPEPIPTELPSPEPPSEECDSNAGVQCLSQCGPWYYHCVEGELKLDAAGIGQICKDNTIVPATECYSEGEPSPTCTQSCYMTSLTEKEVCKFSSCVDCPFCGSTSDPPPAPDDGRCLAIKGNNNGCTDGGCTTCVDGYEFWPCNVKPACCEGGGCQLSDMRLAAASRLEECSTCTLCMDEKKDCKSTSKSYCDAQNGYTWCGGSESYETVTRYLPLYDAKGYPWMIATGSDTWKVAGGQGPLVYHTEPVLGSHVPSQFDEVAASGTLVQGEKIGDSWLKVSYQSPNSNRLQEPNLGALDPFDAELVEACGTTTMEFVLSDKHGHAKNKHCVANVLGNKSDNNLPQLWALHMPPVSVVASMAGMMLLVLGAIVAGRRRARYGVAFDEESLGLTQN